MLIVRYLLGIALIPNAETPRTIAGRGVSASFNRATSYSGASCAARHSLGEGGSHHNSKSPLLPAGYLLIGRRPTLPRTRACRTIGSERLN